MNVKHFKYLFVALALFVSINLINASVCPTGIEYCNPNLPFMNENPVPLQSFFAGMHFHNDSGINIIVNSTPKIINLFTDFEFFDGFQEFNNSTMEVMNNGGIFRIEWTMQGVGTNNHEYEGYIYINEARQNNTYGRTVGQASNEVTLSSFGFIRLNKYDNITLRIADISGTTSGKAYFGNVNVEKIED